MKAAIFFLLLSTVSLFADGPWPGVQFTEVRAYAWRHRKGERHGQVIGPEIALAGAALNKEGAKLTTDQIRRLLAAVTGKHPGHAVADYYNPNNAFVFYNTNKKPVAFVEVCFGSLLTRANPLGAADPLDLISLAGLFEELKLPIGEYPNLQTFEEHFKGK